MASHLREKAWLTFVAWCRARRLTSLPAHPWTVAAYARWCESHYRFPIVVEQVRAIARAHLLSGRRTPDTHPTVTRTLRLIEARHRTRAERAALFREHDFLSAAVAAPKDEAGAKDGLKAKEDRAARRRRRSMPASPRLVSKRPPGSA